MPHKTKHRLLSLKGVFSFLLSTYLLRSPDLKLNTVMNSEALSDGFVDSRYHARPHTKTQQERRSGGRGVGLVLHDPGDLTRVWGPSYLPG